LQINDAEVSEQHSTLAATLYRKQTILNAAVLPLGYSSTLIFEESHELTPRDGGYLLMINMDGVVDNECPPNENGDVDWPLRGVANKDNSEHHDDKQKGDGGPT
jgi:hypothetical protein